MKTKLLIPIFILLAVSGCGLYSVVSTDKDDTADFTKYTTFAWLPDKDNSNNTLNNQIIRNNIKNYFTHELVDNYGFTANTDAPDVLVEFTVTVANKTKTEEHPVTGTVPNYGNYNNNTPNYSTGYPYNNNPYGQNPYSQNQYYTPQPNPYNYNGYNNNNMNSYNNTQNSGYRYQTTYARETHNYTESSITINMIDRKRNELVWTSTAQADIYESDNQNVQNDIHPAVHKMLKTFPLKQVATDKNKSSSETKPVKHKGY
jgi:hypothetical protein